MKNKIWFIVFLTTVLVFGFIVTKYFLLGFKVDRSQYDIPYLHILTYSSFVSPYGPAQELTDLFEQKCQCQIKWIQGGEGGTLLSTLEISRKMPVDIVLGMDVFSTVHALQNFNWIMPQVEDVPWQEHLKVSSSGPLLPFDWSPMTVLYRGNERLELESLHDLLDQSALHPISLQDPRTSTPGLLFFYWLYRSLGKDFMLGYLNQLKDKVRISPSWSMAYGLFQQRQVNSVFTYQTSLLYHKKEEPESIYQSLQFYSGHPYQVEFAGILDTAQQVDLAHSFVDLLLSWQGQQIIRDKNFMFSVRTDVELENISLPEVSLIAYDQLSIFLEDKERLMSTWLDALK